MSESAQTIPTYYPVYLDLRGKRCVVVGGGMVALRKVEGLLEAGAEVVVVAPQLQKMPEQALIWQREFHPNDLDGAMLVIAATDNLEVNALVAREADARHLWVNVVDDPELCTMILPAVVRQGALRIAVSTSGASPTLAGRIRRELETKYGPEYGALLDLLWHLRQEWEPRALAAGMPEANRREAWQAVLDLPLLKQLKAGNATAAREAALNVLRIALESLEPPGHQGTKR